MKTQRTFICCLLSIMLVGYSIQAIINSSFSERPHDRVQYKFEGRILDAPAFFNAECFGSITLQNVILGQREAKVYGRLMVTILK